jgi:hypothetical protein
MNEELQTKVFNWITEVSAKIGDWTSQQLPPFINEYLQWKFFENSIHCALGLLGILLFLIGSIVCYKISWWAYPKSDNWDHEGYSAATVFGCIFSVCLGVTSFITLICGNYIDYGIEAAKIKMAPKVYLMEQASKFIKK